MNHNVSVTLSTDHNNRAIISTQTVLSLTVGKVDHLAKEPDFFPDKFVETKAIKGVNIIALSETRVGHQLEGV